MKSSIKIMKIMSLVVLAVFLYSAPGFSIEHECGSPLLYGGQWYDYHDSHQTGWCGNDIDGEPISADCEERGFGDQREHVVDCYNNDGVCNGNARVYCPNNGSGYGDWITVISTCPQQFVMKAGWFGTSNRRGVHCYSPSNPSGAYKTCGCSYSGGTATMFGGSFDQYGRYICI